MDDNDTTGGESGPICTICGTALTDEEAMSPYTDGDDVVCDECYHEECEFTCCLCREDEQVKHQHRVLVIDDAEQCRFPAGVYAIVAIPYCSSSMWHTPRFYDSSLHHLGDVPDDVDTGGYWAGHLCRECAKRYDLSGIRLAADTDDNNDDS